MIIIGWDSEVRSSEKLSINDDPLKIKLKGGGWTDPSCTFRYIKKEKINTEVLIMFTDMEFDFDFKKQLFPIIWINTYSDQKAPDGYGETINIR
jgi:predicted metal-dependent peptidase